MVEKGERPSTIFKRVKMKEKAAVVVNTALYKC